jgi:Na+/H+ antiporter NhaC
MTAIIVGGSFFGDNLSFISDTTIMATQTQGCRLSDKFRVNLFIVAPAAIIILIVYLLMGRGIHAPAQLPAVEWIKVLPYLIVLVTAILGMNVMAVLTLGIILTGIIGLLTGAFDIYGWFGAMGEGILSMGELIIVTMMAGGMLELIKQQGGIDFIIHMMTRRVNGKRGAELSIAALVSFANMCTANNTIAIITVGGISSDISKRFGLDPRRVASILDTFSCMVQGIIPYGAQLLLASGLTGASVFSISSYLYYPLVMGVCSLLTILIRKS